ncbi:MAG: hypothetical protein WBE69_11440 [Candidatus Binataceae bacterium]
MSFVPFTPPAISTRPLGNNVAVGNSRGSLIGVPTVKELVTES